MESPSSADGAGGAIVEAGFGRSDGRAEDHHLPRISVIIPAFNASAFLRPCIDVVVAAVRSPRIRYLTSLPTENENLHVRRGYLA